MALPAVQQGRGPILVAAAAAAAPQPAQQPINAHQTRFQLGCPEHHQAITTLITILAAKQVVANGSQLLKIKQQIDTLHPFRFLGLILSDPALKISLRECVLVTTKKDVLVNTRKAFLKGLNKNIKAEHDNGNILPHVPLFAAHVKVDAERVRQLIEEGAQTKDWSKFLDFVASEPPRAP